MENDKFESKMNSRFPAVKVGGIGCVQVKKSDRLMILEVYCGSKSKKKIISWERLRVR